MINMNISSSHNGLRERIVTRNATVGVIGLGYVGLPLAVEQARSGFRVLALDDNSVKVDKVNRGTNYVPDVNDDDLYKLTQSGQITASTDYTMLSAADVLLICVPTPLNQHQEPDLSYVTSVTKQLAEIVRKGQLIILESTTYPGTTRDVLCPILESSGLKVGIDIFLAFSPERVDPGNPSFRTRNIPKIVGGITPECTQLATLFYEQALEHVVPVQSSEVAEMAKVFENTYRAVNIALVNELAMLCGRMGLDVWEIIDAAATKPFGIQTFHPGPGVGGHCIPLDPFYLAWKAREYDFPTRFIELAGEINRSMPRYVVQKLQTLLNNDHKSLNGSRILLLGIAYKANSNDDRESPALQVYNLLEKHGAEVMYHDPFIPAVKPQTSFPRSVSSVSYSIDMLKTLDAVVITTEHESVDYQMALEYASLVFDTRNATRGMKSSGARLVRL